MLSGDESLGRDHVGAGGSGAPPERMVGALGDAIPKASAPADDAGGPLFQARDHSSLRGAQRPVRLGGHGVDWLQRLRGLVDTMSWAISRIDASDRVESARPAGVPGCYFGPAAGWVSFERGGAAIDAERAV